MFSCDLVFFSVIILIYCLLSYSVAFEADCDPHSDGKPDCALVESGNYRNFWDHSKFWKCVDTADAVTVHCQDFHWYKAEIDKCIFVDEWTWTAPCKNLKNKNSK